MAHSPSQVRETSISVSGGGTIRETGAAEAAGPLSNEGLIQGARMGNSEPQTSLDLTSESEQDFPDYLRVNNLIFLKLSKKARVINHECITSMNSKFPYAKLENLCADIKERVPMIHSKITKDFIWENVLVWLYAMQRSFEGLHDLKYDDKFNLILLEIIAEYIHYKCQQFAKNEIADSNVVTNEILAVFCVLFESNHAYVLMTLLRINFRGCEFNEKYSSVLCPIFKKYLTKKFTNQSINFSYSRLILCFKKWKSLVHEAKQKETINIIAMGNFKLEKYPTGVLPSEIPEREEKQLLAIFPHYKQAKNFEAKYGRNAGTRTLLREDKSDLNKMISTYFKVFTASLKNGEDDMIWYLEELSTPLEPSDRCHQQRHRNSRIMRKEDNNISDKVIDVIVLPDDDVENNVEKESIVENDTRCSEGDNNNNKNNSVNSSEIEQKSYGAFSDISSGHEEDDFSQDEDYVSSSGTDQKGWVKHSVKVLPSQSTTIFTTETISQISVAMPREYHNFPIAPVVKRWSHTTETNVISGIPTPCMFPNSPSNGTLFLSYQNHPKREVFVNDNNIHSLQIQQQNESHLCATSGNVLQNDTNLVNTRVAKLNNSLSETILSSNISYDNLSDQIGDKTIHLPSKSLAVGSNMSQEKSVNTTHCETRKEIFMRRCVDSDKIESPENKEMERDGQLLNNGKETKTNSESITSDSMKPEDSFAQNSAQSIQNKKNELDNISKQNNLSTEIYDTAKSEPILEVKETSEKPPVLQNEKGPAKELVPEKKQVLHDYPNKIVEGLNIKLRFEGSMHANNVRSFKEKDTEENTEDIAKEVFCLSTEIRDDAATIRPILEAKPILEKPPVLQKAEGSEKELVSDKKQVLKRERIRPKQSTLQKEPALAKESVPEKEQVLNDHPKGNERVEGLNIKPIFGGSIHVNKVISFKEKESVKNTEDIAKEVFCLSTKIYDEPATIKPILEAQEISEKQLVPQNEEGPAKELVPEKEHLLDDYPKGNERAEGLNIKPRLRGSRHVNKVRSCKEKETEKNTEDIAKEVFCLSTEIHDGPATIKTIFEAKPMSEKPPVLQNEERPAKELVPEKEQVLHDYPKVNEIVEGLNLKLRFEGSLHTNNVRSFKEKDTEENIEDIAKKVFCLSTEIRDDAATIKPILETKPLSEKPPVLQNEGLEKELVPEKEQVLDDYPKGNERAEGLNIKPRLRGSMHVNKVRSCKEKQTEKNTEDIAKEVFCLSTEIHDGPATIKTIFEAKPISEKPPVLQNEERPAKELVPEKEQVLHDYPKVNEIVEGLNLKLRFEGSLHTNNVRSFKEKDTEEIIEDIAKKVFCLSTEIRDDAATIKPILETKPLSEKPPVLQNEGLEKELVPEKEQVLDDYPKGNERAEGLNIKPRLRGSMHVNKVRSCKEKETEKNTEDIAKEVFCLSTEIHDDPATIKPIFEAKPMSEKPPVLQNEEGPAKELVPEKEQVLHDYPKGNEIVEGLNIKLRFEGSMHANNVRSFREKDTEENIEDIAKEVFCLSTEIRDDAATIKPILEPKQLLEKPQVLQKEGLTKELVPETEQVLDDYPKGNERAEGLNIKPRLKGSMHVNKVRSCKKKETEKKIKEVFCLSTEIHDNPSTIRPVLEAKPISEKPPVLQNEEGSAKELVSDKKQVLKRKRVRSKQSTPQKDLARAKESVPEKEQVLNDFPMENERVEGLNIKPLFGGSMHVNKVISFKERESEKNTEDIAKEVFCLSTEIHDDPATIKPVLEAKPISEKPPVLQKEEESAKELVSDKKQVLKRERVRSKQSIPQKELASVEESVPKKEEVLGDCPKGNERVEGLNMKSHLGGLILHVNEEISFKKMRTVKNTEDKGNKVLSLSTIKPILETKKITKCQPVPENEAGPAKELTSKTKMYTEIVNSADAIKPPCDNSNNKLETTLQNICKIDAVNENNQDEILRTQSVLKPEYVGGSKTNNIRRRRKSTNDTTKSKKRKMLTGNANLNHRAPANALEDAKDILSFQPKNNVQALQCMLVDAVDKIQESQNSTGKKNIVRVAEGMKNNSKRRKSLTHKLNSEVDIIPVSKTEIGINIAQLVTKPLSKSITDENPISSRIVYGPKNDPSGEPEAWTSSTCVEFLSQRNNMESGILLSKLENPSSMITSERNDITKVKNLTQIQKTHGFNPKTESKKNNSQNLHNKITPERGNDQQARDLRQCSGIECNTSSNSIESSDEFRGNILPEKHGEIDVNLEQETEQHKNFVRNPDFAAELVENKDSLENEPQRVDRDYKITLMDKVDSLLAPLGSLIKKKPKNYNLQASQNSQIPNILKSLNLKKVETITKPSQCLNKPEESKALKQQIKNITNKDCILKASVDEGRKSPTILQEEQQEDINSIQLLNIDSKILKLENEETIKIPEIVETNSTNDTKEQLFPIGVIKSPQSIVDKAVVAHDTEDDSSSPAYSPLSNSSQINDDDAKKSPDYKKRHETTVEKNDEISVISTCLLSNNEMTNTMQNSDENFPASLIAQLDDKKTITMPNSEIFTLISEISTVPLLDEEHTLAENSKTPIPLVSEVPKQEIVSVTPSEESDKFQNFDWTGQVDFNMFENDNKPTSNVRDKNEILTYPDYSHNFDEILDLIDATYTTAHVRTPNDIGWAGVKDVMCAQVLQTVATKKRVPNDNSPVSADFCVSFGHSSVLVTQTPCNGEKSVILGNREEFSTFGSFTTPVLPKTNQPMRDSLKVISENDKKSNEKSNTETKSTDNSNEQISVFELSTFKNSTHVLTKQPVGSMKVIPKTVDDTFKKGTAKSTNKTISDRSKNVVQCVPMKPPSKLSAAPLTFAWQKNKNKIRNDKDKTEGNQVQEKSKVVQEGKDVQSYSVPDKTSPRVAPTKRPAPLNSDPERGQTIDLFEHVKNTPAPSQTLYKGIKQNSFNGNGTVTLQKKVGNNVVSFEVKDGQKRSLEPFEFQPVTNAQLLESLQNEKRKKLQS